MYVPFQGQRSYVASMDVATPGLLTGYGDSEIVMPYINSVGATADVWTVACPATVDNSAVYSLTFNPDIATFMESVTVSYTTPGSATQADLSLGLFNALRAEGRIGGLISVSRNASTHVLTITATMQGTPLVLTSASNATTTNDLTLTNTTVASTTKTSIPFGRFVGRKSDFKNNQACLPDSAAAFSSSGYDLLGVTRQSRGQENIGIFDAAITEYPWMTVMDIVQDTVDRQGIWVEHVAGESITINDKSLYVNVSGSNKGKLTKSSSSTIDVSSRVIVVRDSVVSEGKSLVLVRLARA